MKAHSTSSSQRRTARQPRLSTRSLSRVVLFLELFVDPTIPQRSLK